MVEKVADVADKEGTVRHNAIAQDVKEQNDKRASTVNEAEDAKETQVDTNEKKRQEREKKEREKRKKDIAKRLRKDSGHIIDLEA